MPYQPKTPFLTPSPSPHLCVAKIPNDASPPAKKQRFSSPSPPQARTKPIPKYTAKIPQTVDYVKERHAAVMRLFDVWSSLAERYAKPIDEDDIVDIVTGEIVQDRGVVSSWDESKKGFFTGVGEKKKKGNASKAGERTREGAYEEGTGRREDGGGSDELNSFATEDVRDDTHGEVESHLKPVVVAEAEDNITPVTDRVLEELTEAEERRKEFYDIARLCSKGKARDPMEGPGLSAWGKGRKDAPIEIDLDEDDEESYPSNEDRIQLLQFRTPSPAKPPPASSKCASPDEDDDIEIYQAQLLQFRTPRPLAPASSKCASPDKDDNPEIYQAISELPVSADDGCLPTKDPSDRRQITLSSVPTTIGLDDFHTPLHQFRTPRPRYKQKLRVIVDSDDEFPPLGHKNYLSTSPISSLPSSLAASGITDYLSDSTATLPPPSSSPVLQDGSDDELYGWEVKLRLKPVVVFPQTEAEDNITPVTYGVLEELTGAGKRRKEHYDDDVHLSDEDLEAHHIQFRTPSSARPPPASSKPDEDDDLEIYQDQLRRFRSTAKLISVSADDGCLPTENRSNCRQIPSSSTPTTTGLDDSQTPLHQFRTPYPRYKQKWRVIVDSDDEFPPLGHKSYPSTPPISSLPSSPAASGITDYLSDSPATLPPPSSSPVLEDESDDELYGWDLE